MKTSPRSQNIFSVCYRICVQAVDNGELLGQIQNGSDSVRFVVLESSFQQSHGGLVKHSNLNPSNQRSVELYIQKIC